MVRIDTWKCDDRFESRRVHAYDSVSRLCQHWLWFRMQHPRFLLVAKKVLYWEKRECSLLQKIAQASRGPDVAALCPDCKIKTKKRTKLSPMKESQCSASRSNALGTPKRPPFWLTKNNNSRSYIFKIRQIAKKNRKSHSLNRSRKVSCPDSIERLFTANLLTRAPSSQIWAQSETLINGLQWIWSFHWEGFRGSSCGHHQSGRIIIRNFKTSRLYSNIMYDHRTFVFPSYLMVLARFEMLNIEWRKIRRRSSYAGMPTIIDPE